jgi:inorganic triphosphatase YgiF
MPPIITLAGASTTENLGMASRQEIEVKLRVDPGQLGKIRRSRWWRQIGPGRRQSLHSTYFDSNDRELRDCDISVRTRTDGHEFVQTVKLLNGNALSRREWETLVPDQIPDPSLVIDPALPKNFRKLTSADLEPVFAVDIKRETRRLASDHAQIDVSLDSGAVIVGDERQPIHEIELELVDGEMAGLFAEARRISDASGGRLHLRTKSDMGYALKESKHRHWSRAAKLYLTPEMTARDSFRLIILNSFSHLTANDDCAWLNLHIEGVHQCRIALRRLRSAFKLYRPLLRRKRIEAIESAVRSLGMILGAARDLDVLQTELLEPAIQALGEADHLTPLMATLAARKSQAYRQVSEALGSPDYRRFLIELCALAYAEDLGKVRHDAPSVDQPVAELASRALSKAHGKLLEQGAGFETLSKSGRHEVRIALKRLRYALDFFGNVFDGDARKKYIKRLARLQDDLGRMNDVAVAERMLAQLAGIEREGSTDPAPVASRSQLSFAAGGILGWHRRRAAEIEPQMVRDWNAFVRSKPFWVTE